MISPGRLDEIVMAPIFRIWLTVLTTEANDSMRPVHDRMPLIFDAEQMDAWLKDDSAVPDLLRLAPPVVQPYRDYEQLTLFGE